VVSVNGGEKNVGKPFVKIIHQTVIKPVCSVVNAGDIDNAKGLSSLSRCS